MKSEFGLLLGSGLAYDLFNEIRYPMILSWMGNPTTEHIPACRVNLKLAFWNSVMQVILSGDAKIQVIE